MSTRSFKVTDSLYLVAHSITKGAPATAKAVEVPTDHIMVIDCSGSMSWELPKIREQVKKKIPKMLKETDTLSVVWFSGRGQCGVLLEAEPVATLADLKTVENAVDRWLKPVGMTGFKEPLVKVAELGAKLAKKNPNSARHFFFMSDGCDNQWSRGEILKAIEDAAGAVTSCTVVEYGGYSDRALLAAMAEKGGGSFIFAEDFDRYAPVVEAAMTRKTTSTKRIEVPIKGDPIGGFAYALTGGDLNTFSASDGKIAVPEDTREVYYLSPTLIGTAGDIKAIPYATKAVVDDMIGATYGAISLMAVRMKPDVVFPLLALTGDVTLIEQFSTCFGKQKYSDFMDLSKQAAFDSKLRLVKGYNPKLVPREDAFTVLDVLNLLQQDDEARILMHDPEFKYKRIGSERLDATDQLTDEEQAQVAVLREAMGKTKDAKKLKEITDQISVIVDKPDALNFVRIKNPDGYSIDSLVFNEDRPNVSFRVTYKGTVDISKRKAALKEEWKDKLPDIFPSQEIRAYTAVKDGFINLEVLPCSMSNGTFEKLKAEGVVSGDFQKRVVLELRKLPVINRKMVKSLSAQTFFEQGYELTRARAAQKVYKKYAEELLPKEALADFVTKYGVDAAKWLDEQGFGFHGYAPPHTTSAPKTDEYKSKLLKVSLKGLSSLPKVAEVRGKIMKTGSNKDFAESADFGKFESWIPNPKLNAPSALMKVAVEDVEKFLVSDAYTKAKAKAAVLKAWLEGQKKDSIEKCRGLIFDISQATFCTVVGQVWFKEWDSLDKNEMTITVDGTAVACKVEMIEETIKI
jgi:hypothetical protein